MQEDSLDVIETNSRLYCGIVDHVTSKYVTFYDTAKNDEDAIRIMKMYKSHFSTMRFAVFISTFFSQYVFHSTLLNKKTITHSSKPLEQFLPNRRVFKVNRVLTSIECPDESVCE